MPTVATSIQVALLCYQCMHLRGPSLNICSVLRETLAGDDGVSQSPRQIINTGCKEAMKDGCKTNPCRNNGECRNKMYGFTCDCVNTSYKGTTCTDAVKRSAFDGTQYMNFNIDFPMQSNGEDLSMRFRTKYTPGLLFATTSNESNDQLRMEITDTGSVKLTIDIGQGPEFIQVGNGLDDGDWHALKISRRERTATLIVDKKKKILNLTGQHKVLAYDMLHLARIVENKSIRSDHYTRDFDPFIGSIENLLFDGNYLIDDCFFKDQPCSYNSTFDRGQKVIAYPVSFVESKSFVQLSTQIAKDSLDIAFNLRTIVNDGIILFNGGIAEDKPSKKDGDFIAVELVNGIINFFVSTDGDIQSLVHPLKVNDNQWHQVQIVKESGKQYVLIIDEIQREMGDVKNTCPVLSDSLYIGGVELYMYNNVIPSVLFSSSGYEGCFGSLVINGELSNLMMPDGPIGRAVRSDDTTVLQGCQGPFQTESCPCQNGGICEQRWNGYRCDCSATKYEGNICEQHFFDFSDGPACLFGSDQNAAMKGGVVVYQWSQFPSTRTDTLNLMFQTSSKDATLVKVTGRKPLNDYFKLTIENGYLTLTFNVGAKDVLLKEPKQVADGNLHYVAIKREFMNATMQVDDWQVREVKPRGSFRQSIGLFMATVPTNARRLVSSWLVNKDAVNTVFNTQSSIEIGGVLYPVYDPDATEKLNLSDYKVMKPFVGKMSRVFFNDVRPFELLHANDDSVFTIGDVERIGFPETSTSPSTMTSQAPTAPSYSSQDMTYATNECDNEVCQGDNEPITTPLPPIKLALIAGVVSAAVMLVFAFLACVYCYKSKGARRRRAARYVYNIGENNEQVNNKKIKMTSQDQQRQQQRGDTISRNGTPPGKDDKEYYV